MSASISSLLADKLDVSDEKAKKLLVAMLREVKKRAFREGVRLPEFGTFRGHDGQLTFEPSPSLARAVNEQFEGLKSEDLGTAPSRDQKEEETDDGPDTITLGYQDSDWTPLDSEEAEGATDEEDDDAADTAEFQVPSAEEAADTDELQVQDVADEAPAQTEAEPSSPQEPDAPSPAQDAPSQQQASESPAERSSRDSSSSDDRETQTEDLYPLVEDVPGSSKADETNDETTEEPDTREPLPDQKREEEDEERASLSGIWSSEDDDEDEPVESQPVADTTAPEPDPAPEPESRQATGSAAEPEPVADPEPSEDSSSPSDTSASPDAPSSSDSPPTEEEPVPPDESEAEKKGSTGARVLVGLLVVLMLAGAGWYVLGQRGMIQKPRTTFAQVKSQLQPHVRDLPLVGTTSQQSGSDTESPPTATATADASAESTTPSVTPKQDDAQPSETSSSSTPTTDANQASTSQASESPSAPAAPSNKSQRASSQGIAASAGGWTIIVASRTERDPAQSLVEKYRTVFASQNLPIDVLTGNVEGQTRYRIGVGQFSSRSKAQSFLEEAGDKLPEGAWILSL